jgi:hypothetical protein
MTMPTFNLLPIAKKLFGNQNLDHPLYNPGLAPSDFHLFGPLKEDPKGCSFADDVKVKEKVQDQQCTQPYKHPFMVYKNLWTTKISVMRSRLFTRMIEL